MLRVQDVTGSLSETAYSETFTMLKGQSFYLLADPKGSGAYDSPWFFATVEKTGELPAYAYGQNGVSMDTQGEKGWTAVYSTAVNQTAGFPTATFQPAEYKTAESQNVWKPQAAANATPADPVYYFGIRPDGFVGPATGLHRRDEMDSAGNGILRCVGSIFRWPGQRRAGRRSHLRHLSGSSETA